MHRKISRATALLVCLACQGVLSTSSANCPGQGHTDSCDNEDSDIVALTRVRGSIRRELRQTASSTAPPHRSPVSLVNVLAGTNARSDLSAGNTLPIIARPWGFNHWAVQSKQVNDAFWFSPTDVQFVGLRCTHQPSPWVGDYGHFLIDPFFGKPSAGDMLDVGMGMYQPAQAQFRPYNFRASVLQPEESRGSIEMEMTPTAHGALLRVTLPRGQAGGLRFSLPVGEKAEWKAAGEASLVTGFTDSRSTVPGGKYPSNFGMYIAVEPADGLPVSWWFSGSGVALLSFPESSTKATVRTVRLATSFISISQARTHLKREIGGKSFEQLTKEAKDEWNTLMKRVEVEFEDEARAAVFYTNLYRGMLFPRDFSEQNEAGATVHYSAYNGKVVPGRAVTDQGFWDAYRTVYPMLSLIFPDKLGEMIEGWVNAYKEAGWLPTWASPGQRVCMVGTMGDCSLADAVVKHQQGLMTGFNATEAYEAIVHDALNPPDPDAKGVDLGRSALQEYESLGYVPSDSQDVDNARAQTAALTLNYQLADACVALAADAMGDHNTATVLRQRSKRYPSMFDNQTRYFRPRKLDGQWDSAGGDDTPVTWGDGFTEAAAAQYRFYVPHDIPGLSSLFGGQDGLCKEIQAMLDKSEGSATDFQPGSYGSVIHEMREAAILEAPFGLLAHNNQPTHHVLWVAAAAGCSTMAQRYLRRVMDELYTIDGWSGDEDNGEMASWYILSSLGIYSLVPGSDELVLGSPEVTSATITVPDREVLRIEAQGNSAEAVFVSSVTWEGSQVEGPTVGYSHLAKGGVLSFSMSSNPTHDNSERWA